MKRLTTLLLVCLYSICITLFLYCNRSGDKSETTSPTYHRYEILYPDYSHDDTLVVYDEAGLNAIFSGEDAPATDIEISEALHLHCHPYTTTWSDYGLEADSTGYTIWDNNRLVAHFGFDKDPVLDSIIMKDNQ